jgi:hypothetical protein
LKKSVPRGPSTAKAVAKLEVGTGILNAMETLSSVAWQGRKLKNRKCCKPKGKLQTSKILKLKKDAKRNKD